MYVCAFYSIPILQCLTFILLLFPIFCCTSGTEYSWYAVHDMNICSVCKQIKKVWKQMSFCLMTSSTINPTLVNYFNISFNLCSSLWSPPNYYFLGLFHFQIFYAFSSCFSPLNTFVTDLVFLLQSSLHLYLQIVMLHYAWIFSIIFFLMPLPHIFPYSVHYYIIIPWWH
jgi:hypothetical protein